MSSGHQHPKDLVRAVATQLRRRHRSVPPLDILVDLFETLFYASLRTEEREPITCDVIYLDPQNPDPHPPLRIVRDRWAFLPLQTPVRLTTANLAKLAKSSDPRSSSLVVFPNSEGRLCIWGLIDQATSFYEFVNFDAQMAQDRPGLFHVGIKDVGHLVVFIELEKVAELRSDVLTGTTL